MEIASRRCIFKKNNMKPIKKRFIWNNLRGLFIYPIIKKISDYSKLPYDALWQVYDLVNRLDKQNIEGALVEMGCWKGGCGSLMSWTTKKNGSNRITWLFDSFEGLPELSEEDREWAEKSNLKIKDGQTRELKSIGYYKVNEESVKEALDKLGSKNNTRVVAGWFQDVLPDLKQEIGKIALLRLDGDIYESTKYCMDELYDLVTPGGYVVIDDFGLNGCRRALYEYFYNKNVSPYIQYAPYGGRAYFRKK